MIAYLTGKVRSQTIDTVVLDVQGVGYLVHVPVGTLGKVSFDEQQHVGLEIHTSVREDAIQLYGFANDEDKFLFTKLISISGVGPKLALAVLSEMTPEDIVGAVRTNSVEQFTRVSGIGKKTAQRLILELKSMVDDLALPSVASVASITPAGGVLDDLRSALLNLGYTPQHVESVSEKLAPQAEEIHDMELLLREALKMLR